MRAAAVVVVLAACSTAALPAEPDAPVVFDGPGAAVPDAPPPPAPDAPPPALPPRYTSDRTLSPITAAVARNLQGIAARNGDTLVDSAFMKVGDSITVAPEFMSCFAGTAYDLGGRTELQSVVTTFAGWFARVSLAAQIGWSADAAIAGDPSPLDEEVAAAKPRYAIVMFGTNDADSRSLYTYAASLWTVVDTLAGDGVVPIMSSVPSNTSSTAPSAATIARENAVARGLAQARMFPFMDYFEELEPLPALGLGPDGVHPSVYPGGACKLTAAGLAYGFNVRNLLTLESLLRARAAVEGDPPPDPEPTSPAVGGDGSYDRPFGVSGFPFTDLRDTSRSTNTKFTRYTGCSASQDESGPEYVYKLVLVAPATIRATVMVRGTTDVDVHLLSDLSVAGCIQRNDKEVVATLDAGTYYFALDTFVPADGTPRAGEYLFLVTSE